jgi:hypothetical protein
MIQFTQRRLLSAVHAAMTLTLIGMIVTVTLATDANAPASPLVVLNVVLLCLLGVLTALEIAITSSEDTLVSAVTPKRQLAPSAQRPLQIGDYVGTYSRPDVSGLAQLEATKVA